MLETTVSESEVAIAQPVPAIAQLALPAVPVALHRTQLRDFLKSRGSRFVCIDYVKLDGSPRRVIGRFGVRSHLKGGRNNVEAMARPYLTIFDTQAKEYRTVNLATVKAVRSNRNVYELVD